MEKHKKLSPTLTKINFHFTFNRLRINSSLHRFNSQAWNEKHWSQSYEECIDVTVEKMETIEKHLELQETLMSLAMKNPMTENGSSFDNSLEVIHLLFLNDGICISIRRLRGPPWSPQEKSCWVKCLELGESCEYCGNAGKSE